MVDILDQSGQFDEKTKVWVRAFFAVRGWTLGQVDPAQGALAIQQAAFDRLIAARNQLRANPPEGVPPMNWQTIELAERTVANALSRGDERGAAQWIQALATFLREVAGYRNQGATGGPKKPTTDERFAWHAAELPQARTSPMSLRLPVAADGTLGALKLAGRPRGKHGGAQGQHVSAFVTIREAAVSATWGRTPDQAKLNVAHLFKGLLAYPAFGPTTPAPGPDPEMLATVRGLARKDDQVWARFDLPQALAYFVEVRDSLPGASMPRRNHADTNGKGEAVAVARIAAFDAAIDPATGCTEAEANDIVLELKTLLDPGAVADLGSEPRRRHARESFVLGIAQAFPRVFSCVASDDEGDPVGHIGAFLAGSLGVDKNIADLGLACARLPVGEPPGARPRPETFCVGVDPAGPGKPMCLDFTGRPAESVKESSQMGDHTCSMRLMSSGLSGALLPEAMAYPTKGKVAGRLASILRDFDPAAYNDTWPPAPPASSGFVDPFASYRARLVKMTEIYNRLTTLAGQLQADAASPTTSPILSEIGEEVMRLMDQRPTAVTYIGGSSKGKGEGTAGATLDQAEAALRAGGAADPRVFGPALLKLFDPRAASITRHDLLRLDPRRAAAYLDRIVGEFVWFVANGYPRCLRAIGEDALRQAVTKVIEDTDPNAEPDDDPVDEAELGIDADEPPPPPRARSTRTSRPTAKKRQYEEDEEEERQAFAAAAAPPAAVADTATPVDEDEDRDDMTGVTLDDDGSDAVDEDDDDDDNDDKDEDEEVLDPIVSRRPAKKVRR